MFERYKTLADRIACRYARTGVTRFVPLDDLLCAARAGLWHAATHSDLEDLSRFEAYAGLCIAGALREEMRRYDWLTRRARKKLQTTGDGVFVVLSGDLAGDDAEALLRVEASAELDALARSDARYLERLIYRLPAREQQITRWVLAGLTLAEIAERMGLSAPRLSQLYGRALHLLKEAARTLPP